MKSSKKQTITVFLVVSLLQIGFKIQSQNVKWGKISDQHFSLDTVSYQPEADAVILNDQGSIRIESTPVGFQYVYKRHKRIKFLKPSGFEYADIQIPYYHTDKNEQISGLKAQIFNPDGTKVSVSKSEFIKEKINENWSSITFTFPNVQVGSIIEFQYTIVSKRIVTLRDWYFQTEIPVLLSTFELDHPGYFDYVALTGGYANVETDSRTNDANTDGFRHFIRSFAAKNVLGLKEEAYTTIMEDYYSRVTFQLSLISFPSGPTEKYLSTWEKLAERLMNDDDFGTISSKKRFQTKVFEACEPNVSNYNSASEKINYLYNLVNDKFIAEDITSPYFHKKLDDILESGETTSGGLNLILLGLLKHYGFEVYPVMISTRDNGRPIELYPIINQFNHCILVTELDGKRIFLDAGDVNRPMGIVRISAQNGMGWKVDEQSPEWIEITKPRSMDYIRIEGALSNEGILSGKLFGRYSGYNAIPEREAHDENDEGSHWINRLSSYGDPSINLLSVKENKFFEEELAVELSSAATSINDFIYFNPIIYTSFKENPFNSNQRNYPVDMPYPFQELIQLDIELPEGYTIEEVPESVQFKIENDGGSFQYVVDTNNNKLNLRSMISIKRDKFNIEEYSTLKQFFDLVVEKLNEQLVLKKS